ncbi:MAG: RNA polymerase factor sigma-54 [Crocinitomicaceae bacterium]|jgi:RNA polymerase sigma-54 factor|nr:RNA polymerase factor sigma-54 [Crocinitomicaceae bacterium]MBT6030390.1 RNA polymerase factor sigma-54 [Crocinitomicaceae bacterium]
MLKQRLQHKLLQKLSPQQIQLMKLLQVPTVELEQRIKEEIEENPALEEGMEQDDSQSELENDDKFEGDDAESRDAEEFDINDYLDDDIPSYKTQISNKGADTDEKAVPLSGGQTFQELLEEQIGLRIRDEKELIIAKTIIGNLDDGGYLRREVIHLVDDLAFSQNVVCEEEDVLEILKQVQNLDPAGVGARDLKECLLIQLRRKEHMTIEQKTAEVVLDKFFDEFSKKHYTKIVKKLDIEPEDLKDAVQEIVKLNPKPGNSMRATSRSIHQIIPDFIIRENEGELSLSLNSRNAPQLKVSRGYNEMLETYASSQKTKKDKEAIMFVKQKIDSAKWFIDAIKQRQQTLLVTMEAIMSYQNDFFLTGDETTLKPMILKDIAEIVGLDISTISRVANSKHAQTPYGTYLLKYFFSESLSTDSGEEVSTREVKKILQDAIDGEIKKKPLTDEKLATLLKEKGYNIARRTVAKYREQLNIPVARLRKEL